MKYTIAQINQMTQPEFTANFGAIFEKTPCIAEQVWHARPFSDRTDLHQKMMQIIAAMTKTDQIHLIQSHPDLGSRAKMAEASVKEQAGVGLNQLGPKKYHRFKALNEAYHQKFNFPFVMAVKGQTQDHILDAFEKRLGHCQAEEIQQALLEISAIARFRLQDLIVE